MRVSTAIDIRRATDNVDETAAGQVAGGLWLVILVR
jgi:hypothetical protein